MKVKVKEVEVKLPDFLIVGAAKSGTTSLYYYLKEHPKIFMSPKKEPWFFTFAESNNNQEYLKKNNDLVLNFDDYLGLFYDSHDTQFLGEASTVYLYLYEETVNNLKKYHPEWQKLKIIIIIRNPIERAYSHYLNDYSNGLITYSFNELIKKWEKGGLSIIDNYIDYGFYYKQIKHYKDNFKNVKICTFEDLKENSIQLMEELFAFLGVYNSFPSKTDLKYNMSFHSKNKFLGNLIYKPNLLKGTIKTFLPETIRVKMRNKILEILTHKSSAETSHRDFLREIYKEDITNLQDLIKKDLSHWLMP